jgi:hypothetical protein
MGRWDDGTLGRLTLLLLNLDFQSSLLLLTRNLAPVMAVYGLNPSVTLPPHDDVSKSALRAIVLQRTQVIA